MQEFLKPIEVATKLHITERTLRAYMRSGTLRGLKLGGRWLIPASELEKLQASAHQENDGDGGVQ